MVRTEGLAVPVSIAGVIGGLGLIFASVWPRAIVVDFSGNTEQLTGFAGDWWLTLGLGALVGLAAGFALDRVAWFNGVYRSVDEVDKLDGSVEGTDVKRSVWSIADGVASLPLVGLFLGWQAVVSVFVLLVLMLPFRMLVGCRVCVSLQAQVFLATLVQLSCWRFVSWAEWL